MQTNTMPTVPVYNFRLLEGGFESAPLADFKATREQIRNVYHGLLLEGTQELVPVDALDDAGRYRRIATGWGQLS